MLRMRCTFFLRYVFGQINKIFIEECSLVFMHVSCKQGWSSIKSGHCFLLILAKSQKGFSISSSCCLPTIVCTVCQRVGCEGACTHAHKQFVVAHVHVHAKSILKRACCVRACGSFLGMRCAITLLHTFWNKTTRSIYSVLERSFLF